MLTGTIINSLTILCGSLLGLAIQAVTRRSAKDVSAGSTGGRLQAIVMEGMALCVIYIGVNGSLKGQNTLTAIISIAIGAIIGELLDLDRRMRTLGDWVQEKTARLIHTREGAPSVADGFVTASLLFCVGAMAVVSALRQPRAQKAAALTLAAVSALWLGISGVSANAARLSEREGLAQFAADAQTLMAQVPEDERDSFMAYRVEPKWYVAAKALPCMRFYFLQEILAQADPAVMDEIVDTFETDPPRWLVLFYNRTFSPPYDERVAQIFETEYERVDTAGQYQLLCLKE